MSSFSEEQLAVLSGMNMGMSAISFLGSAFIVSNYIAFKKLRKFAFRLVLNMVFCDMITSIGRFMGPPRNKAVCYIQAYLTSFGELSSMLWTVTIAFTIHQIFFKHNVRVTSLYKWYHVFVWSITIVLVILPQTTGSYGDSGAWCWIVNSPTGKVWRYIQFYIPLWLSITYISYIYWQILKIERQHKRHQHTSAATKSDKVVATAVSRMKFYPLILIIAYFWATINRIYNLVTGDQLFWLTFLHVFFDSMQGLMNAIVYGMTPAVMRHDRAFVVKQFQKCGMCLNRPAEFTDARSTKEAGIKDDDPNLDDDDDDDDDDGLSVLGRSPKRHVHQNDHHDEELHGLQSSRSDDHAEHEIEDADDVRDPQDLKDFSGGVELDHFERKPNSSHMMIGMRDPQRLSMNTTTAVEIINEDHQSERSSGDMEENRSHTENSLGDSSDQDNVGDQDSFSGEHPK